jgi:KipI family sensor histidine kinase inhibitor
MVTIDCPAAGPGAHPETSALLPLVAAAAPPFRTEERRRRELVDHGRVARTRAAGAGVRVLPYGDRALLVEVDDLDAVAGVRAALGRSPLSGQLDVVPAARTVLVVLDRPPSELDVAALHRLSLEGPDGNDGAPLVDLPVVFDGPDLDEVAALTGRSVPALVAALTSAELTVAFGGFAPGFGYLAGLPESLHVPRRATPRTRVPAGSVGLAGPFAGAYPQASPGGWQLVGRTGAVLFDVDRDPPALLTPGTRVRFREVG